MKTLVIKYWSWDSENWHTFSDYILTGSWYIDTDGVLRLETKYNYGRVAIFKFFGSKYRSTSYLSEHIFIELCNDEKLKGAKINSRGNIKELTGEYFYDSLIKRYRLAQKKEAWVRDDDISFIQKCES